MLDQILPVEQIANVNIVPRYGDNWVAIQLSDGTLDIPGGTLEPGEDYMHAIQRELMEEAGAQLQSSQMIGAWQCFSLADKPYRSHLPFPNFYRLVLTGGIRFKQSPGNPPGGEVVSSVVCARLLNITGFIK
jgi:8-oxo-dGTP pyrophosphatase MutT (NUDIX family)